MAVELDDFVMSDDDDDDDDSLDSGVDLPQLIKRSIHDELMTHLGRENQLKMMKTCRANHLSKLNQ
jgi:hypothetical protein